MSGYIGVKAPGVSSGTEYKKKFSITGTTTSLTGLTYNTGRVHLFHNGVRLVDGTDYTATDGTNITLTVAAESGDEIVVVSQASFQLSDHYTKTEADAAFLSPTGDGSALTGTGSPSIDDNGNATAITIDSSENVLVGKTTDAFGTAGIALRSTVADFTRDSGTPVNVNRLTDDGRLIALHKDSVVVGSTGVVGGNDLYIAGGATGIRFDSDVAKIYPTNGTGAVSNGAVDIGEVNFRFKDAYLSGGVYLGGTGSANKLDDYEEGTWTPDISWVGVNAETYSRQVGSYVKIGQFVFCSIAIIFDRNTSTGVFGMGGFPFTNNASSSNDRGVGKFGYFSGLSDGSKSPLFLMEHNNNFGYFRLSGGTASDNGTAYMTDNSIGSSVNFHMDVTYRTTQ